MASTQIVERLQEVDGQAKALDTSDMDLTDGTASERSLVASYQARVPLAVRDDAAGRLMFTAGEEFTTDATADNEEEFSLSHDLVDTKNTQNFILYEAGSRVQPGSVDYDGNSFKYTDDGTENDLHAFYVARDPGSVVIEKVAPKTSSQVSKILGEDTTSGLADRDQNKEPVTFDFVGALEGVIPASWKLNIYVDSPHAVRWDDSGLSTTNGDEATNAVVSIPIYQFEEKVPGLQQAVKRDVLGIGE